MDTNKQTIPAGGQFASDTINLILQYPLQEQNNIINEIIAGVHAHRQKQLADYETSMNAISDTMPFLKHALSKD